MTPDNKTTHSHGPANVEHELRKAYNTVIETGVCHFWDRKGIAGVNAHEAVTVYKRAYSCFKLGNRLAAERWARTAKHLSRAFWHEAKLAYLEPIANDLPFLLGAQDEEYNLHERPDTTEDLLASVENCLPASMSEMPEDMKRYLTRAKKHLKIIENPEYIHELLRAERIKAAHEYGRVLECMLLAYEAEAAQKTAA